MDKKKLKNINWNWIYSFYEAARFSSMKEAAKMMGVSISTISEQIAALEKDINVKLFHRSTRKIELTNEGVSLYAYAKRMFEYGQKILDNVSPDLLGGYPVRVGIQEGIANGYSLNFLIQYWDYYLPYGTVNTVRIFHPDEMYNRISRGELDWGIVHEQQDLSRIYSKIICKAKLLFCCSARVYHKFKEKRDILTYIPFVQSTWDINLNKAVSDHFSKIACRPSEIIELDHKELCIDLIKKHRCVSLLSDITIKQLFADSTSELVSFYIDTPIYLNLYAVWPKGKDNMLPIKKLGDLLEANPLNNTFDPDLQFKVGEIPQTILKDKEQ
ncbi:MAG: LysR family transcriptional regulator [Oligoflexia bacterium]|nr:LysR family transcriptional regulator [Oligoflexia bacterium]MBF0366976.1 LysR family transcriptional regulator [Oligoflexia bacterium]